MSAPVVVTPIRPEQSTTLRLNKWYAILTAGAAAAVTVVDFAVQLFADPLLVPAIQKFIPDVETRLIVVTLVGILARQNWKKRLETAQPIAGSPGEAKVQLLGALRAAKKEGVKIA